MDVENWALCDVWSCFSFEISDGTPICLSFFLTAASSWFEHRMDRIILKYRKIHFYASF